MGENFNPIDFANLLQGQLYNNNNSDGLSGNSGLLLLLLFFMFGGYGGYGFGGNRVGANSTTLAADAAVTSAIETAVAKSQAEGLSDQLVIQAINGNKEALDRISTALNFDFNQVNDAVNLINSAVSGVANQVGMTSQQIVNAIQSGNCALMNAVQSNACDINNNITKFNYDNQLQIINQTNALNNTLTTQTGMLAAKIDAQTQVINDRFCDLEIREQARIIDKQNADISELKSRISTQEILTAIATSGSAATAAKASTTAG